MGRERNRLLPVDLNRLPVGKHHDGNGLYLLVTEGADKKLNRSWARRFNFGGREQWLGLGSFHILSLAEARKRNLAVSLDLLNGVNPLDEKRAAKAAKKATAIKRLTFKQCLDSYLKAHAHGWRSSKHGRHWEQSLKDHVFPVLGAVPISDIDRGLVVQAIQPIWTEKTETARRCLNRIVNILDWAEAAGHRSEDRPVRIKLVTKALGSQGVRQVRHFTAMPYTDAPAFLSELRQVASIAARCLEFLVLTAVRTNEAIGARWDEIDMAGKVWIIPADRTKTQQKHSVPLSSAAIAVLEKMATRREGELVFPGRSKETLSHYTLLALISRMGRNVTAHGFRSCFRDWAADQTTTENIVAELSLAHRVTGVEAAYRRSDLLARRRVLMDQWAEYLANSVVVQLPARERVA